MNYENCPCCPNHCEENHLRCEVGKEYFENKKNQTIKKPQEQVLMELKKCGHMLHHNKNLDYEKLFSDISLEECNRLQDLLSKITKNFP